MSNYSEHHTWRKLPYLTVCGHDDCVSLSASHDMDVPGFSLQFTLKHLPTLRELVAELEKMAKAQEKARAEVVE